MAANHGGNKASTDANTPEETEKSTFLDLEESRPDCNLLLDSSLAERA
jgi:hypothetical protein